MSDGLIITGSSGNDSIFGSNDNDTLNGGSGDDEITGGGGDDLIFSGDGNDKVLGGEGADIIVTGHRPGETNNRQLTYQYDYTGIDDVNTGSGDDYLFVGVSLNGSSYKGGDGFDVITFGSNTIAENITITGFEVWNFAGEYPNYIDSSGNQIDYLSGEIDLHGYSVSQGDFVFSNSNFTGLESKLQIIDWVYTNEFDASAVDQGDGIIFRKSKDTYNSNEQALIKGSQLDDEYYGCPVDDKFQGNGGDDYFEGGEGTDVAIFSGNRSDYTISQVGYSNYLIIDNRGIEGTDTLKGIETLRFQDQDIDVSPAGQEIDGTSLNDELIGGSGDDEITGGGGDDLIFSGDGNDKVLGGEGADIIVTGHRPGETNNRQLTYQYDYTGIDDVNTGSGDDYLFVGVSLNGSSYKGGDGFDVITFGSNTIAENITITGFEVWNFAGEYPNYIDSSGNQIDYLSGEIDLHGYSVSQGDFVFSNSNFTGLESKLQIIDWVYTNEFDASAVDQGDGIIFRKSKDTYNSNEQALIKGSQLDDEYYGCPVDDKFQGNGGDDYFEGGEGTDVAIFSGNRSDYRITASIYYLQQKIQVSGPDGTDQLIGVETLRFDDGDLDVTPDGRTIRDRGQARFDGIDGNRIYGETLTAGDLIDDPDGIDPLFSDIKYQWQKASFDANEWVDISAATENKYVITESDVGENLRITATYTDNQGIRSTVGSDSIIISSKAIPEITFEQVADDNAITLAEKQQGVVLTGKNAGYNVSISFSGTVRRAANNGEDWIYRLTNHDWKNIGSGSSNIFTASFSKEGETTHDLIQRVVISSEIEDTEDRSVIDRRQRNGLSFDSQSIVDADGKFLDFDKDGNADIYQDEMAILPWTTSSVFKSGREADIENVAAIKTSSIHSVRSIEVLEKLGNNYLVPMSDGSTYRSSVASKYRTDYDPVAFNISGMRAGGTTIAEIYLPSSLTDANTYLRYNYREKKFMPYLDRDGVPLYEFSRINGRPTKVVLTMTDGDEEWDGDGLKNGRIVDPGMVAYTDEVITTTSTDTTSADSSSTDTTSTESESTTEIPVIKIATVNSDYTADPKGFASISAPAPVTVTAYEVGTETTLDSIKDYDGNLHAGDNLDSTASSYKYQGLLDVNGDGVFETIFTNKVSRRWVTAKVDSITGQIDFSDHGAGGGTRVVGIYEDPLIAEGEKYGGFLSDGKTPAPANFGVSDADRYVDLNGDGDFNDDNEDRLALNSQVRFQNDLKIDNLEAKHSGDYDGDGIHEVYWKTADGTAYLRSLMHSDGNIRYANYQSAAQMSKYLTTLGHAKIISDII